MNKPNQSGLSLIEVLIASVILFSIIVLASSVFEGSLLLQKRADKELQKVSYLPSVVNEINFNLEADIYTGSLAWGEERYDWQAELIEQKNEVSGFNAELNQLESDGKLMLLYQVKVISEKGKTYSYMYSKWKNSQA